MRRPRVPLATRLRGVRKHGCRAHGKLVLSVDDPVSSVERRQSAGKDFLFLPEPPCSLAGAIAPPSAASGLGTQNATDSRPFWRARVADSPSPVWNRVISATTLSSFRTAFSNVRKIPQLIRRKSLTLPLWCIRLVPELKGNVPVALHVAGPTHL